MKEIKRLAKKTYIVAKSGGVIALSKEINHYIKSGVRKTGAGFLFKEDNSADVLFITCSADGIDYAPSRYRVFFQKKQLESQGISVDIIYYADLKELDVDKYDVFILHRVPFLVKLDKLIVRAKKQNKMVIYDIDDLMFEKKLLENKNEVAKMSNIEKDKYFDGVERGLKMLKLCDYGTTSTEVIAEYMRKYIDNVIVNRNGFSEDLLRISKDISHSKVMKDGMIVLGYFSGSATHDDDLELIAKPVSLILKKYNKVNLLIVGDVTLPDVLKPFTKQIKYHKFVHWQKLPELLSSIDINLAPLTNTIFNSAKSEIKYTEAALVKVPTIASRINPFTFAIKHKETGFIAENEKEWFNCIEQLIIDEKLRQNIAMKAFEDVTEQYNTKKQGKILSNFLEANRAQKIAYVIPTTNISGGVMVVAQHTKKLQERGYNTLLVSCGPSKELNWIDNFAVPVIRYETFLTNQQNKFLDIAVATLWSTLKYVSDSNAKQKFYFVQNREYDFYKKDNPLYYKAKETYQNDSVKIFTMSRWCKDWLNTEFNKYAEYVPNGIDTNVFNTLGDRFAQKTGNKIRILIEGNPDDHYKNVDESFEIINHLNMERYEIWFISYGGKPKKWYKYDKFFQGVPFEDMPKYYRSCDIFLKTSKLESFSYPPLEMMACGGVCVLAENGGNEAYAKNNYNCLSYEVGDINTAVKNINKLVDDSALRNVIIIGGVETARQWAWSTSIDKLENVLFGDENC